MSDPEIYGNPKKLGEVQGRFNKTEEELEAANQRWTEVAMKIDSLS
jgi:hypothetical protein